MEEVMELMQEQGIRFVVEEEEEEDWDDILEDMDDPWMREPAPAMEIESEAGTAPEPASAYSEDAGFTNIGVPQLLALLASAAHDS